MNDEAAEDKNQRRRANVRLGRWLLAGLVFIGAVTTIAVLETTDFRQQAGLIQPNAPSLWRNGLIDVVVFFGLSVMVWVVWRFAYRPR